MEAASLRQMTPMPATAAAQLHSLLKPAPIARAGALETETFSLGLMAVTFTQEVALGFMSGDPLPVSVH